VVYLQVLESTQPLRRVATPNSVDPFHTTALGRAIASRLPEAERDSLLRRAKLEPLTPHSVVDLGKLQAIIAKAARDGYAIEVNETDVGVTCIGAPILSDDAVVGAISISAPTVRSTGDARGKLIDDVCHAAAAVSAAVSSRNHHESPRKRRSKKMQTR
jgi:DNA-binding IclR family transcriptional regulator